jgi:hypothetical protein
MPVRKMNPHRGHAPIQQMKFVESLPKRSRSRETKYMDENLSNGASRELVAARRIFGQSARITIH